MVNRPCITSDWMETTLGHMADYINGRAFKPHEWGSSGLPIIRIEQINDSEASCDYYDGHVDDQHRIENGDLLFSWSATLTTQVWTRGPAVLNQHIFKVVPAEGVDLAFLHHLLDYSLDGLAGKSHGSTMKHVKRSDLLPFKIRAPLLYDQRRIAEILDTIDEAIQKTEVLISKLKAMKQGLLHDLLTRGLDKNRKLRDPEAYPEQFKNSPVGGIPKEWEPVHLLDLISIPNGQVDPKQKPYCYWPLIAPDHIESDTGRLLCLKTAIEQGAISGKYAFKPGDVLYSKIRPYLRKAVIADRQGLCSADMYPLQSGPSLVPRFLLDVILGEHFSRFASSVSERSGFPKINRKELGEYRLALPPRDEQLKIASIMDSHDTRIRTEEQYRDKLKLQEKGLMHDLLTGKVRVNV